MINLTEYFSRIKERVGQEYGRFRIWATHFDYFASRNPMSEENRISFTKSLPKIITSNFEVAYNSFGMVLTRRRNIKGLEPIVALA
tara:strand:- start:60 stop:317 length:258 start_codon:yes stop_codon:yes gene_type:complete